MCAHSPMEDTIWTGAAASHGVREGAYRKARCRECTVVLVERDTKDFAAAIQLLLDDPLLAETYGRNGWEHVMRNWTWEKSVTALETQLSRCAGAAA